MKKLLSTVFIMLFCFSVFAGSLSAGTSLGVCVQANRFKDSSGDFILTDVQVFRNVKLGWAFGKFTPHVDAKFGAVVHSGEYGFSAVRPFTYLFLGGGMKYDVLKKLSLDFSAALGTGYYMSNSHGFNMVEASLACEYPLFTTEDGVGFVLGLPVCYRRGSYCDSLSIGITAGVRK